MTHTATTFIFPKNVFYFYLCEHSFICESNVFIFILSLSFSDVLENFLWKSCAIITFFSLPLSLFIKKKKIQYHRIEDRLFIFVAKWQNARTLHERILNLLKQDNGSFSLIFDLASTSEFFSSINKKERKNNIDAIGKIITKISVRCNDNFFIVA